MHEWIMSAALLLTVAGTASAQAPVVRVEPTAFDVPGIGRVEAELGRFSVPEDRRSPDGRRVELVFGRLTSTAATPGSPIVFLDGGPGGSGIGAARIPAWYALFDQLRQVGDVILLSQRGTGLSSPRLACRSDEPTPPSVFESADAMTRALAPRTKACLEQWRGTVDLAAFNTEASADDLEDLRLALRVPTISLLGFSYGTHLALSAVRRHSGSVDRVVLAGTEGPDHSLKLPHTFDLQLARIAALESAEPAPPTPGLVEATRTLLDRLAISPVAVELTPAGAAAPVRLSIGREGFQYLLRRDIGDTNDTANLVRLIRETARGELGMLTRFVSRRFNELAGGTALMGTAMDCASGASPERRARINREVPGSLLGRMTNYPYPDICEFAGLTPLPPTFREPVQSMLPALFVSGTLDSNTPPYQAEEVRWGFPNSTHLVVEHAGHESTLPLPEVQRAIVDFLKGIDVRDRRVAAPNPLR